MRRNGGPGFRLLAASWLIVAIQPALALGVAAAAAPQVVKSFSAVGLDWNQGKVGLSLGTPDRPLTFRRGGLMEVPVVIRNTSDGAILITNPNAGGVVTMRDDRHRLCCDPYPTFFSTAANGPPPVRLEVGDALVAKFDLSRRFRTLLPGNYTLTVVRCIETTTGNDVITSAIDVRIE